MTTHPGTLHVIATPIGNLGDITLRAIETLRAVDVLFCEDTRLTGKLLERLELPKTELVRADAEKEASATNYALQCLESGKQVGYVSDAGTPGVSDPGARLVAVVRVAGYPVVAIPGASSVTTAISIAGLTSDRFSFLGFVPHKKGRQTFFAAIADYTRPVVFFESPHRIIKTLEALEANYPEASVKIGRELTKLHEELLTGTPAELLAILEQNKEKIKGEFVVIIS